jgi:hypothetical protein
MGPLYYKHLKAGQIMSDKIDHPGDVKLFNFNINLDSEKDNALSLNLIPVKGKFRLAVRSDGREPDELQKYWNTDDDHILIKSSDAMYKSHAEYTVAVWGIVTDEQSKEYFKTKDPLNYQFRLRYSHMGKHVMLQPGHQEVGTLEKDSHCFAAVLNPNNQQVMIFKSMTTFN